jgi:hypothetical protein
MSIEAMKQALDALEQLQGGCTDSDDGTVEAITVCCPEVIDALRQAIEQAEKQEPVGKFAKFSDGVWKEVTEGSAGVLLYTSPPPRQPLTDEVTQIADALRSHGLTLVKTANGYDVINLGQITAHGIREKA